MMNPFLICHTPPTSMEEAERRIKDFGLIRLDDLIGLPWRDKDQLKAVLGRMGWNVSSQETISIKGNIYETIKTDATHQDGRSMKLVMNVMKNSDQPYAFLVNVAIKGEREEE
jgi:hypothetical protein